MKKIAFFVAAALFALCLFSPACAQAHQPDGTYTVYIKGLPTETAQGILKGEKVTDGASKTEIGYVDQILLTPTLYNVYSPERSCFLAIPASGLTDATVTVRADLQRKDGRLYAGGLELLCGKTVALHLPHLCREAVILEVKP